MARLIPAIIQGFLISVFAFAFLIVPQIAPAAERSTAESRKSEMMANWPKSPSESWSITIGGRLYDNWATVQGIDLPKDTHPTYPKGLKAVQGMSRVGLPGRQGRVRNGVTFFRHQRRCQTFRPPARQDCPGHQTRLS